MDAVEQPALAEIARVRPRHQLNVASVYKAEQNTRPSPAVVCVTVQSSWRNVPLQESSMTAMGVGPFDELLPGSVRHRSSRPGEPRGPANGQRPMTGFPAGLWRIRCPTRA